MYFFLFAIAFLFLLFFTLLKIPSFGKLPIGNHLEKIKASANYRNGEFQNLSPTKMLPDGKNVLDIFWGMRKRSKESIPNKPIEVVQTDLKTFHPTEPTLIWFGHSSYLLYLEGKKILIDPVLCKYASPFTFLGTKSYPKTYEYNIQDFPSIDLVLFSHDHYDHLDYNLIKELNNITEKFISPLGVGAHLKKWGVPLSKITELDWHESNAPFSEITITCTPARHFSGRALKRNQTLWSSFVLQTKTKKLFLGGDSGYDIHFKSIGAQYGPFDLAILECGQYNDLWPNIHMMPEDTVQACMDLKAKHLLPVHWGKFSLAFHSWNESIIRVTKEAANKNLSIYTPKIGAALYLHEGNKTEAWWN